MVMDAQPSPLSVGREFVRQYYTLLNKAPNHLHRFYNNHSSFIHGGDSQNRETVPVVGQKNIYSRIQQLNFRDCHAKISQVDAQATLGNGVVVQVTGELSNDGQPMRRFTQTFVLAPQSPKNYYVHNDIFRYQDLYSDEENETENRSENDEEQEEPKIIEANQQNTMGQPQQIYYQLPAAAVAAIPASVGQTVPIPPFTAQPPQVNGVVHDELLQVMQPAAQPAQIAAQTVMPPQPPQQQVTGHQAQVVTTVSVAVSTPVSSALAATTAAITPLPVDSTNKDLNVNLQKQVTRNASPDVPPVSDSPVKQENEVKKEEFKASLEPTEKPEAIKMPQNEPKTYANLFKSINTNSTTSGFVSLPTPPHQQNMLGQSPATKQQELRSDPTPAGALPQRTSSNRQSKDFSERRVSNSNSQYSDSHQLFFGNVPHHATEEELRTLFNKFGPVVDLRLHSKTGSKVPGVRVSPNYGFVTYDDPESVQNCLSNCPLYFPDNAPDGQKLNVEEKKVRQRNNANDVNRVSNMSGNNGMGNSQRASGGPNRSLSNSGGIMRGGAGGSGGPPRGSAGGPRPSGSFPRNDRGTGGPPSRQTGNNSTPNTGSANSYGRR